MTQTPSAGRIVHYVSEGSPVLPDGTQKYTSECRAAIVTAVPDVQVPEGSVVSLCVLNPTGFFFRADVAYHGGDTGPDHDGEKVTDISYHGGTWHWPERV